ncbi:MAG TPA: nucleoside phosphorylase [Syntrophorhabdaceae bacterium]|nr:nucleoside phosphorylase [Syntrophorhabdaceae bacterium]
MKNFFDSSKGVLKPIELVCSITKRSYHELGLPKRTIIVFSKNDLRRLLTLFEHKLKDTWAPFRTIYEIKETILTKSGIGGPNIATIVEEFSDFGVREFILWGYCGGIKDRLKIGDIVLALGALREDGVSYHYIEDNSSHIVYSPWVDEWRMHAKQAGFLEGVVWSCDAIYRETEQKITKYRKEGVLAVEMEVASFYSVCNYKKVKGIAFLVVSDILTIKKWVPGFHKEQFKKGSKKLLKFITEKAII